MPIPSGGSIRRAVVAAGLAVLAGLLLAAGALAAEYRPAGNFGCTPTAPCGSDTSWEPERLSVDEKTGDVYVIDKGNGGVVQVFDSKGKWLIQITGFNFSGAYNDIAVDNSGGPNDGRVYVSSHATTTIIAIDPLAPDLASTTIDAPFHCAAMLCATMRAKTSATLPGA